MQILNRKLLRGLAPAALAMGLSAALGSGAQAEEFQFTLSGVFNGTPDITNSLNTVSPAGPNLLTANDPFTLTAEFDSSAVVFGIPGFFNAYAPQSITLSVGGTTYSVATISQNLGACPNRLCIRRFDEG